MNLREMSAQDIEEVKHLHQKMQMGYPFPDWSPLYAVRRAASNGTGKIVGASAIKVVGEAFLWLDPEVSVRKRIESIVDLSIDCAQACHDIGLEEVSAWIPPEIEARFAPLLERLGWKKSRWPTWTKVIR